MKTSLLLTAALLTLSGCGSLAPGAEKVRITHEARDVVGCKIIGPVSGNGDAIEKKNVVLASGGDTLLITSSWIIAPQYKGIAYNCSGVDLRQPVPVTK